MPGNRLQRNLATASRVLALLVLAGCSESATRGPTDPEPVPPLSASISPTADTVRSARWSISPSRSPVATPTPNRLGRVPRLMP